MPRRQLKRFKYEHYLSGYDLEGEVDYIVEELKKTKADILEKYPDATKIRLDYDWFDDSARYDVHYYRMETLEEMRERVALEKEREKNQRERDKKQLVALKKKLGVD